MVLEFGVIGVVKDHHHGMVPLIVVRIDEWKFITGLFKHLSKWNEFDETW
jgi:D-aminopeptidase